MSKINTKTWNKTLAESIKLHGASRDLIQSLCLFAMTQAGNGNYTYINEMMNADYKGADHRAMQKYFEDHCDVTLGRKDKTFAFTNNKTKDFNYVAATKTWWEYKPTAEPAVIDPLSLFVGAIKKLERGINHTGGASITKGKEGLAKDLLAYIKKQPEILKQSLAA